MKHFFKDLLTARNGIDYSLTKLMGITAGVTMLVKFWGIEAPDFTGLGLGISAIMAALAGKYYVEKPAASSILPEPEETGGFQEGVI